MKKIWIFILGILTGIVVTFLTLMIIAKASNANSNGMTFFDQPGQIMDDTSFRVIQSLESNAALANGKKYDTDNIYLGLTVLLYNENNETYYDDQIVTVPKGKCFRQVGVYKYQTRMDIGKTVPIVMLMDK